MVGSALPAVAGIAQAAQRLASQRQAVQLLNDAPAAVRDRILQNLGAQKRAVLSELLGQDRVGQTTLLELIFRGPGSAP
jgi:Mg/Co/Ni transporter MgtE